MARAIKSLQSQTYKYWIAVIQDDCPNNSAKIIYDTMNDGRLFYKPNPNNFGICANIDLAFSRPSQRGNVEAICVLEDDNYYLPDNLEKNVQILESSPVDIIVRNQFVERMIRHNEAGILTTNTNFGLNYPNGIMSRERFISNLFFSSGANNSSLFWRAGCGIDFSTLEILDDPVSQERLRTLRIDRNVWIASEPTIVWRDNGSESLRPNAKGFFRWRYLQIKSATHERLIYHALWNHLASLGLTHLIFEPLSGEFAANHERVLERVGLRVPKQLKHLPIWERSLLAAKREAARFFGQIFGFEEIFHINPDSLRVEAKSASSGPKDK